MTPKTDATCRVCTTIDSWISTAAPPRPRPPFPLVTPLEVDQTVFNCNRMALTASEL